MIPRLLTPSLSGRSAVLRVVSATALLAGLFDVSVALLNKPRDLSEVGAFPLPLLAVAASFAVCLLVLWASIKPVIARTSIRLDAAFAALTTFVFMLLALSLLIGLHTSSMSAHSVFRAGIIAAMSAKFAVGAFSRQAAVTDPGRLERRVVLLIGAPLLMFEVLLYEWLQVYAISSVISLASALATAALLVAATATVVTFARIGPAAAGRALAAFVVLLVTAPVASSLTGRHGTAVQAQGSAQTGAPRRVILITVDSLRMDAVSAYGQGTLTPAIDSLAADSIVFDNAWSTTPWTLPALGSMLSGLAPAVHGVTGLTSQLSDRVTTVAETLSSHGFQTAAIVHNPLLEPARNFAQGFAEYTDLHEPSYGGSLGARLLQALGLGVPPATWPASANITDAALEWLTANQSEHFFLWLHYFDPHAPYAPPGGQLLRQPPTGMGERFDEQTALANGVIVPPRESREWIRELYDAEVRDVDANIRRLMAALEQLEMYEDTLILLSSDHGEEFWEHGRQGHGQSLHPELLRVPLIVKLPGSSPPRRVSAAVSTMSVAPSILELCGIRFRADEFSAPSLAPLTRGEPAALTPAPVVSGVVWTEGSFVDERQAVGFDQYRYISAAIPGKDELFDHRTDADEQRSVADSSPEPVAKARHLLEEHARQGRELRSRLQIQAAELDLDDATLKKLRTLGYMQ